MKKEAVLSRTTTDQIKSKILSTEVVQLVLDVYMTPQEYADFLSRHFDNSFEINLPK